MIVDNYDIVKDDHYFMTLVAALGQNYAPLRTHEIELGYARKLYKDTLNILRNEYYIRNNFKTEADWDTFYNSLNCQ